MARAFFLALFLTLAPSAIAQSMQTDAQPVGGSLIPGDGTIDASIQVRSSTEVPVDNCYGYVDPSAPDVVVEWDGGDLEVSVQGSFDPTLAVHGPDGRWTCDDDTNNLLPVVRLSNAPAGRYAVWVGSFSPGAQETATVFAGVPPPRPVLDASASALAGTVQAAEGFEAQGAIEVTVRAGGMNSAQETDMGGRVFEEDYCTGFIDAAHPTVVIAYDGTGDLGLSATSPDTDLVLVVQAPDGTVRCNDDFNSRDPALGFSPAESGDYAVWVGTFSLESDTVGATLAVSEEAPVYEDLYTDDFMDGDAGFGAYSSGTYVLLDLDATPASRVRASADDGGSADISIRPSVQNPVQGGSCRGYVELAPTAAIELSGEGPFALTASSDDDLTLTVRTPSGDWFCSDDADGLNPGIQIDSTEAGSYLAWVGTFGEREEAVSGTVSAMPGELTVTNNDFGVGGYDGPTQSEGVYDGDDLGGDAATAVTFDGSRIREEVGAGGSMLNPVEGETCGGFVSAQPTLSVEADGMVQISASSDQDLTLTIQAPDGSWTCSDDADGTNPSALVDGGEGVYSVWVGTYYRRTEPIPATVTVEEGIIEEVELDMMDTPPMPETIRG